MSANGAVCPCMAEGDGLCYPVTGLGVTDRRFSTGLIRDVTEVLDAYGFPWIEEDSPDWYALTWVLWRFCYGRSSAVVTTSGEQGNQARESGGTR